MKVGWFLFGGAALPMKFKIGATFSSAGVPAVQAWTSPDNGIRPMQGAVLATDYIGLTIDTGTYSETQGDTEGVITVVISPDVVLKARMCNSATSGTQLVTTTNSVAETAGTTVTITTGDPAPNSPDLAQGTIACISGANKGQSRKFITSAATTAAATSPFTNDIASGDVFLIVPWFVMSNGGSDNVQVTTDLTEARQDIAAGTGIPSEIWETKFDFSDVSSARRESYLYFSPNDIVGFGNT